MVPVVTLYELVCAVVRCARSEAEAVATVAYMVNAGKVRLVGPLRAPRFGLRGMADVGRRVQRGAAKRCR